MCVANGSVQLCCCIQLDEQYWRDWGPNPTWSNSKMVYLFIYHEFIHRVHEKNKIIKIYLKNKKLENVAIVRHCNLRPPALPPDPPYPPAHSSGNHQARKLHLVLYKCV